MITVVFQYKHYREKFYPIYYALRSWEKYFTEDFSIVFIGDLPPNINAPLLPKDPLKGEVAVYASITSLKMAMGSDLVTNSFIYTYDDIYLLKPIGIQEINKFYYLNYPSQKNPKPGPHGDLIAKTLKHLDGVVKSPVNAETHLPRFYNKNMLTRLMEWHSPYENALLVPTLYANIFHDDAGRVELHAYDKIKAGFYGVSATHSVRADKKERVGQWCRHKLFLNHGSQFANRAMQEFLKESFPDKSKWEKN